MKWGRFNYFKSIWTMQRFIRPYRRYYSTQHHGATPEGTRAFFLNKPSKLKTLNPRTQWTMSSIGFSGFKADGSIGYIDAVTNSIRGGVNVIEVGTQYREGHGETIFGVALKRIIDHENIQRQNLIVCDRIGVLTEGVLKSMMEQKPQLLEKVKKVGNMIYSLDPDVLQFQIDISLQKLGIQTIDLLNFQNPETLLTVIPSEGEIELFKEQLHKTFSFLESQVSIGKIQGYGVYSNTWSKGYNFKRDDDEPFAKMSFDFLLDVAKSVQEDHHFVSVGYPLNIIESKVLGLQEAFKKEEMIQLASRPINAIINTNKISKESGKDALHYQLVNLPKEDTDIGEKCKEAFETCISLENMFEHEIMPTLHPERFKYPKDIFKIGKIILSNVSRLDLYMYDLFYENNVKDVLDKSLEDLEKESDNVKVWCNRYRTAVQMLHTSFLGVLKTNRAHELKYLFDKIDHVAPSMQKYPNYSQKAVKAVLETPITTCFVGLNKNAYVHDIIGKVDVSRDGMDVKEIFDVGREHVHVVKEFIIEQFHKEENADRKKREMQREERKRIQQMEKDMKEIEKKSKED